MPTTNHTITVTIDGVDRSSSLLYDALSVRVGVGNTGNVADLRVLEDQGYVPQAWDEVTVAVDATRIFGGFVATRTAQGLAAGSSRTVQWSLACRDWSMLLDKIIVNDQFAGMTDANIVITLFNDYLAGNGFILTEVQFTRAGLTIGFERVTLRQALNKLAEQVGAAWYIDPLKRIYWYNRWSPPRAAFHIDTAAPTNSTTFDVMAGSIRRTIDDTKAINQVTVFGKDVQGTLHIETILTTSHNQLEFGPLLNPLHSVVSVVVDFINFPNSTIQGRLIGYEPDGVLYASGVTMEESRDCFVLVNREKRTLKIRTALPDPLDTASITVTYYEATPISVTVDDTDLQGLHERVLMQQVYDPSIADEEQAAAYGRYIIDVFGRGSETVTFDVPEFGLLPGSEINVYSPTLGLDPVEAQADLLLQDAFHWLLESGSQLLQESFGESALSLLKLESGDDLLLENGWFVRLERVLETGDYIVQEVSYRPVHTPTGWMMVASVTAGEYEQTLIDIVAKLSGGAGVAGLPAAQLHGRVSDIASDLGEVVAGRALFTDGGLGQFNWGTPNGHTGVVVGLDDSATEPAGALYIYDAGTNRLKLGDMTGLPAVGTVNPSGWGIWTDNGYFSGQIAASNIYGGTISGVSLIGQTITGGLFQAGTVRTGTAVHNSSNPGVTIDSNGLTGYGTLGLTFSIPTDPAQRPIFSSGTILNTVYEVTTSSVLRTGTINPKVQIDNSGIFAYNSGGTLKFSVDAATGLLTAVDGTFSGSVTASSITGGTVSGALVSAGTVSGARVTAGTVSGALVSGGTVSGALVSAGTVSGALVTAGTVSGALVSGGTVSGALMTAGTVRFSGSYGTAQLTDSGMSMQVGTASVSEANAVGLSFLGTAGSNLVAKIYMVNAPTYRNMVLNSMGANDYIDFLIGGNGILTVQSDGLNCGKSVFPAGSSLDLTLGLPGGGWRYIYLKDNLGNIRQLEINNGTVLIS